MAWQLQHVWYAAHPGRYSGGRRKYNIIIVMDKSNLRYVESATTSRRESVHGNGKLYAH